MMCEQDHTVVIVEDDDHIREYLSELLTSDGYDCQSFPDGTSALRWLAAAQQPAHLMLSDINMPGMNGLELLQTVKTVTPDLPFILLSGLCDFSSAMQALRAGASDYLLKPARPDDILKMVEKHLNGAEQNQLRAVKIMLARQLGTRNGSLGKNASHLAPVFDLLGFKRFETFQHSQRVAAFALMIGNRLRLTDTSLEALEIGSLLHDVGKAGIPHNVLMKPGKLTAEEWEIIKMHPKLGWDLLRDLPGMDLEAQIVYSHHERFDGRGYPRQLAGASIPQEARTFSVADTLDAITADRCYRKRQLLAVARSEIQRMAGSQFDPAVVEQFQQIADHDINEVHEQYADLKEIDAGQHAFRAKLL